MTDKNTGPTRALEPRYYTDREIYRRELSTLLARAWQFAGHVSQLPDSGDYFTVTIAEQNLFCMRGGDGRVRAFYNVCQHRAHELLQGSGNRKVITCPYHAWSYRLDGRFLSGPNVKSVADFPREDIRLAEVRAEIFCGFIFVNLDPDAAPMAEWFPGAQEELREYVPDIEQLQPLLWLEIPEHCNWKVSVENYSECYHCRINHRTFSTGVVRPETYDIQPHGRCLRHTSECQNLGQLSYPVDLAANPHAGKYSSWFLWPAFSFQVYPGNLLNTYHWRPAGVDQVTVWRGWFTSGGGESKVVRDLAAQDRATTVAEDIRLVESVQRGLNSRGYRPGVLVVDPESGVNSEHSLRAMHQWLREDLG